MVQPYLFFDGRCEEAIAFYRKALGAEVEMMMRFKDAPADPEAPQNASEGCAGGPGPENAEKIMHASLRIGGTSVMASDGMCKGQPKFEGFSLAHAVQTEAEAQRVFAALSEGGRVEMPLGRTFFSPAFGMLADKFGVSWMVLVEQQQ